MKRHFWRKWLVVFLTLFAATVGVLAQPSSPAEEKADEPADLRAHSRVAFESGFRTVGIYRGNKGTYFVLNGRDRVVWLYNNQFNPVGRIGGYGQGVADLQEPKSLTSTSDGKVIIGDYGGDAVKIYAQNGVLNSSFKFRRPWSVGTLSTGEILVSGFSFDSLIHVYDVDGKHLRSIGKPVQADDDPKRNALLNVGQIVVDSEDNIYYAFIFLPNPTIRKYNPKGELLTEIHLSGKGIGEVAARAKEKLEKSRTQGSYGVNRVLHSLALDGETGDLWVSSAYYIYVFGSDGSVKNAYIFKHPDNFRTHANHLLVEANRVLVVSLAHGVFECSKPK